MFEPPPPKVVKAVLRKPTGTMRSGLGKLATPVDAIRACIEYAKVLETEKTKRAEIRAKRDVAVEAITAQKEIVLRYFELRFAERRDALGALFRELDEGLRTKDDKLLDGALCGIVAVMKDNPLRDFDSFRQSMQQPGFMLDL